jgi:multidrug efflux pump subunit AcrA (membrane-fusion protein)
VRPETERAIEELQSTRQQVAVLAAQVDTLHQQLTDAERATTLAQAAIDESQARRREERAELDRSLERQRLLARLTSELFNIPESMLESVLQSTWTPQPGTDPPSMEQLEAEFRRLSAARPESMVRHLLTFEEIRKRCDIWELHYVAANRELVVRVRNEAYALLVPLQGNATGGDVDQLRFERELHSLLTSLPQAKGLVIALLTYDDDATYLAVEPIEAGIANVLRRLRLENAGRTQIEFANLGIILPGEIAP